MVVDNYWSGYRTNLSRMDGPRAIKIAAALEEIERAIRETFAAASRVTARTEASDVLVEFLPGQKPVSVCFNAQVLETYRHCADASRLDALRTLRLVCAVAFAREYTADYDPVDPFVIDATMALLST